MDLTKTLVGYLTFMVSDLHCLSEVTEGDKLTSFKT